MSCVPFFQLVTRPQFSRNDFLYLSGSVCVLIFSYHYVVRALGTMSVMRRAIILRANQVRANQ